MRYKVQGLYFMDFVDPTDHWFDVGNCYTQKGARRAWLRLVNLPHNKDGLTIYRIWDNWLNEPVEL